MYFITILDESAFFCNYILKLVLLGTLTTGIQQNFKVSSTVHSGISTTAIASMEPSATVSMTVALVETTIIPLLTQTARLATTTKSTDLASSKISSRMSSSQTVLANPSVEETATHKIAMPVPTESPIPANQNTNTALYIGVIVPLVTLLLIIALKAVVTVVCVSVKKKKTTPGE